MSDSSTSTDPTVLVGNDSQMADAANLESDPQPVRRSVSGAGKLRRTRKTERDGIMRLHPKAMLAGFVLVICATTMLAQAVAAASAYEINQQVDAAVASLYATTPAALELSKKARAILVFPSIVKAGFLFGGQFGEGALRQRGQTLGYYSTVAASYGLQIGVQTFGYAMFLMNDKAMNFLNQQGGWELGVGPSIVVLDQGLARSFTTATAVDDVYAFIFNQQGLMAGMGLQGSKITPYTPDD
jgi:lipid-binding SYLF domain-containing protein